jgi:hypothetical protein
MQCYHDYAALFMSLCLKKQKPEDAGSRGAVQALKMGNDGHAVGPDAPIANSKMVKPELRIADWNRPTSVCSSTGSW